MAKTPRELLGEANETIDELRATIEELTEAGEGELHCKYEPCPDQRPGASKRAKALDYLSGISQGLTTVAVIWLLTREYAADLLEQLGGR